MSDGGSSGPWWVASDGRWYPPELHPDRQVPEPGVRPAVAGAPGPDPTGHRPRLSRAIWLNLTLVVALIVTGVAIGVTTRSDNAALAGQISPITTIPGHGLLTPRPTPAATVPAPTATTVGGTPATTLVTPAVEQAVLTSTWTPFAAAFAEDNTGAMAQFATPAAYGAVESSLLCGCKPWPTAYTSVSFSAPPQTAYPLSFLAEFAGTDYDGAGQVREVVFAKAAPGEPWLVSYAGDYEDGSTQMAPGTNVTTAASVNTTLSGTPAQLATYFQTLDTTGQAAPPTDLVDDAVLSDEAANSLQVFEDDQDEKLSDSWVHTVSAQSTVFSLGGTSALVCATLSISKVSHGPSGLVFEQPTDRSSYGSQLAPGTYSALNSVGTVQWCFASTGGLNYPLTNEGGVYVVSGTPAG